MEQFNDENEEQRKIREENEIRKIKLSLEHGASFGEVPDSNLPPELESLWLTQIEQFERSFSNVKLIRIYDLIGRPEWTPVNDIADENLDAEIDRVLDLLNAKSIGVGTICEVDERDFYRFLTEELFQHEVNDHGVEGMMTQFIYEEFHPNHAYDIERYCREFIEVFLKEGQLPDPVFIHLASKVETGAGHVNVEEAVSKMEAFRGLFRSFELNDCTMTSLDIRDREADISFDLHYTGLSEGNERIEFKGVCSFGMVTEYGYWNIGRYSIPGFNG